MIGLAVTAAAVLLQGGAAPNPLMLHFDGMREGSARLQMNEMLDLRTGREASVDDLVRAAVGKPFVFLGEEHDCPEHHVMQAKVIDALAASGRNVIVGFEMLTRPKQDCLAPWAMGAWDEAKFLEESDWQHQWGMPFSLYRPIFEVIRKRHLRAVALNVPRPWVHSVATGGYEALSAEDRADLPKELYLGDADHKAIFDAMMGGHPMPPGMGDHLYAAQVLWDEGMADTAIKYLAHETVTPETVFVVVAGSGHVMYGRGINFRIRRRTGMDGVTLVMTDSTGPVEVSRAIGDFAYLSRSPIRSQGSE